MDIFEVRCRPEVSRIAVVFNMENGAQIYVRRSDVEIGPLDEDGTHLCKIPMTVAIERGLTKEPKSDN